MPHTSISMLQGSSLIIYITLLVVLRPYVNNKYRFWKLYVTVFNNFTALTVVAARLVSEQAAHVTGTLIGCLERCYLLKVLFSG